MTETLRDVLHQQAEGADLSAPDVAGIIRDGERKVRRRRLGVVAAGVAAAAVIGGAAIGIGALVGNDDDQALPADPGRAAVSYALGSTIHTGDTTVDVGHPVRGYVRLANGYAFFDDQGRVYSVVDGTVTPIGQAATNPDQARLVADDEGTRVAWVDTGGEKPKFAVADTATGRTKTFPAQAGRTWSLSSDGKNPVLVTAMDGNLLYVMDRLGTSSIEIDSGYLKPLTGPQVGAVLDVEDGSMAFRMDEATVVGTGWADGLQLAGGPSSAAVFSPGARWITVDGDEPRIYDVGSGEPVTLDVDGRAFATGYEWLADDTLAVFAARTNDGPVELLTCTVPTGDCEVAEEDLGSFEELNGSFALPVGRTTGR